MLIIIITDSGTSFALFSLTSTAIDMITKLSVKITSDLTSSSLTSTSVCFTLLKLFSRTGCYKCD